MLKQEWQDKGAQGWLTRAEVYFPGVEGVNPLGFTNTAPLAWREVDKSCHHMAEEKDHKTNTASLPFILRRKKLRKKKKERKIYGVSAKNSRGLSVGMRKGRTVLEARRDVLAKKYQEGGRGGGR